MGKLLAAGGVVLVVLAVLLLHLMKGSTEVDAAPPAPVAVAPPAPVAAPHVLAPQPVVNTAAVDVKEGQVNPYSREWQEVFDDPQPKKLLKEAAKCYAGGINRVARDAKLKLTFKDKIVNGEVRVTDVKVVDDTLNNKALADCFIAKVSAYTWKSDKLPNWEQDDMLLIRPERGMKKYLPENMNYEGDGPEFPGGKAVEPVRVPESEAPRGE